MCDDDLRRLTAQRVCRVIQKDIGRRAVDAVEGRPQADVLTVEAFRARHRFGRRTDGGSRRRVEFAVDV